MSLSLEVGVGLKAQKVIQNELILNGGDFNPQRWDR